jgi:hypothetical protein
MTTGYEQVIAARVGMVRADMRTFLEARVRGMVGDDRNIGGGNVSGALLAFALLGLLGKCRRAVEKPETFGPRRSRTRARIGETDETECFTELVPWLQERGVRVLGRVEGDLPAGDVGNAARIVWRGYRNDLMHRLDTRHFLTAFLYATDIETVADAEKMVSAGIKNGFDLPAELRSAQRRR